MRKKKTEPVIVVFIILYIAAALLVLRGIHPLVHALGRKTVTVEIGAEGAEVKATLSKSGVLTISGNGRTRDFTEETAPFAEYADRINSVIIKEGVAGIGDYLLYNCGNLKGTLNIPSTVLWIGDGAFNGDSYENSPKFTTVTNEFLSAEVGRAKPGETIPETETVPETTATPGNAASPGETTGAESPAPAPGMEETESPSGEHGSGEETSGADEGESESGPGQESTESGPGQEGSRPGIESGSGQEGPSSEASQEKDESGNRPDTTTAPSEEKTESEIEEAPETESFESQPLVKNVSSQSVRIAGKTEGSWFKLSTPSSAATGSDAEEVEAEEDTEEEEETEEDYSMEDGELSNDLYEDVVLISLLDDRTRELYTVEVLTTQIIGTSIFYPGQTGAYQCCEENTAFAEAAMEAGYQRASRFIDVDLEGTVVSLPVVDGVFYAPEYPGEEEDQETGEDSLFYDSFAGWSMERDWETMGYSASVYAPGTPVPVEEETETVTLYGNWEKTCSIVPGVMAEKGESYTTYTLIDEDTGEPLPDIDGYRILCQWQICLPRQQDQVLDQIAETDQTTEAEQITGPGQSVESDPILEADPITESNQDNLIAADPWDESAWEDIPGADSAVYRREALKEDEASFFRVRVTIEKQTYFRAASEPVTLVTDPYSGLYTLKHITVTYLPGDGAGGTPPDQDIIEEGGDFSPALNTFIRNTEDGMVFTGWKASVNGAVIKLPSGTSLTDESVISLSSPTLKLEAASGVVNPSVTLTAQWSAATVVYVDSVTGVNSGNGQTREAPVKSLSYAYSQLPADGSAETNIICLLSNYTTPSNDSFMENYNTRRNFTICGQGKDVTTLTRFNTYGAMAGDMIVRDLKLVMARDCSCQGFNLIIEPSAMIVGSRILSESEAWEFGAPVGISALHIMARTNEEDRVYGPRGDSRDNPIVIKIMGEGSNIARLVGGDRTPKGAHNTTVDKQSYADITVDAGTVGVLAAGSIAGITNYINTDVHINGGTIYSIVGGQHFAGTGAVLKGIYRVYINGGTVETLYGGSLGRAVSDGNSSYLDSELYINGGNVKTVYSGGATGYFEGTIKVEMNGGTIDEFYGGGYGRSDYVKGTSYRNDAAKVHAPVDIKINGGTINGNLYAGGGGYQDPDAGNTGSAVIEGDVTLSISGGTVNGNVYGAGNGILEDPTAAKIFGDVSVSITGGTINGNVYGGGKLGSLDGSASLSVTGSPTITGTIYGGGDSAGTVNSTNVTIDTVLGGVSGKNNVFGGGNGADTIVNSSLVTIGQSADINGTVYGGGEEGKTGSTRLILAGGRVQGDVYGGGNAANVDGTVSIDAAEGSEVTGNIYGGSNSSGQIGGQITINAAGKSVNIYGAGNGFDTQAAAGTSVTISDKAVITANIYGGGAEGGASSTQLDIHGGTIGGSIYGGCNDKGEVSQTNINISGNIPNAVFGGGFGINTTVKNSKITVLTGVSPTGILYGGGEMGKTENSQVLISNGSKAANVFGGGRSSDVTVSSLLTVENGAQAVSVYGGSNESGTVTGAKLVISGIVTNVYGGGLGGDTITKAPTITAENGSKITELYGGGKLGKTTNGTTILLKNGSRADQVFGGGSDAGIEGTAIVQMEDGSRVWKVYGGSNSSGSVEAASLTINGTVGGNETTGTVDGPGAVYGGGQGEQTSTGKAEVEIGTTALVTGEVFGGGAKGPVTGDTKVVLKTSGHAGESQITGNVYAGGDAATVGGSTRLEANDGAVIAGSLYGGGKGKTAVIGTDTRVLAFAHVTGNVFGGGAEGDVNGNTHVDIAKGTIDGDGVNTGNVFGGSDRSYVVGNTQVHIGVEAATGTDTDVAGASLTIKGSVFGGGNTTDTGSNFDASDPFVKGTATVKIDATDYNVSSFNIGKSILGDGNMCTVKGSRTVTIKGYQAVETQANTSIQRADTLILEKSRVELTGAVDSANLVPTIAYSLNRIDHLIMKGGSTLRLQAPVNLVKELVSQDAAGNRVTTTATTEIAAKPSTENHIDIQQGVQMELRTSEDVTTMEYGAVSGFMILDVYDPDASKEIESGIYVLGNYVADESLGGFLYGSGESQYKRIDPSTDEANWRNWAIGTDMKKTDIMVMSDKPAGGKVIEITSPWPADGSVYRLVQNTDKESPVTITSSLTDGSKFVLKDPEALDSGDPVDTTLGIAVKAGNLGWVNPMTMGYIAGDSEQGAKGGGYGGLATESLQTLNNRSVNPTILVELTNRGGITATDEDYPLIVTFQLENVKMLSDGGFSVQGKLTVELKIRRESLDTYDDVLISTGKEYVRAIQTYDFGTKNGETGATISQKSAVTLQYGKKGGSGDAAIDHKLSFSIGDTPTTPGTTTKLPEGVTILAVDRSGGDPVYAHYTVPAGGVSEVLLSEFTKNGSDESYQSSLSYYDRENYLFILDFANAPSAYSQDKLCAAFEPIYSPGSSAPVKQVKILFGVAASQQSYGISSPEATGAEKEGAFYDREAVIPLTLITYAEGGSGGVDTTGNDMEMGARLRLKNRDVGTYVPVPTDWFVEKGGAKTGELAGGGISVPLGNSMMSSTSSLGINTKPSSLTAGGYQWEIYLTSSPLSAYPGTLTGTPLYLNFNIMDKRYSIQADYKDPSASRLYPAETAEPRQPLKLCLQAKAENGATADGVVERASLWKKDQITGEYAQVDFGTLFDGLTGTNTDYEWQESRDITYTLKNSLPEGTYRLRYELVQTGGGANQVLTYDTENFIVTP